MSNQLHQSQSPHQPKKTEAIDCSDTGFGWGYRQMVAADYWMLLVCVFAQIATILITWSLWQVRDSPINLPWAGGTPQFSCGLLLLASLLAVVVSPRKYGMAIHLLVLLCAVSMDQFRCQPQILSVTVLMVCCVWPDTKPLAIWFLISMWFWAGVHKLISPDWFGSNADFLFAPIGIPDANLQIAIAALIAIGEILVAASAWWRPKLGAVACVLLHVGIFSFLVTIGWNASVLPWNLCTAIVGGWVLWTHVPLPKGTAEHRSKSITIPNVLWKRAIVGTMFLSPLTFYLGAVRHCFAHVLYSGNHPTANITRAKGIEVPRSYESLNVPFPHCEKAFKDYFRLTSQPGDKLHIYRPLASLPNRYFLFNAAEQVETISEDRFFSAAHESDLKEVQGIAVDSANAVLNLARGGVNMQRRSEDSMIFSARFTPAFYSPERLPLLIGLPNLEELSLEGCNVTDQDLAMLPKLKRLVGVVLRDTKVTETGLRLLEEQPNLEVIEY